MPEKPLLAADLPRFQVLQVQVPGMPLKIAFVADEISAKNDSHTHYSQRSGNMR